MEGESGLDIVMEYLKGKEEVESALKSQAADQPLSILRTKGPKKKVGIHHPSPPPIEDLALAGLSIANKIKDAFIDRKDNLSNWDTIFLLARHYPDGLTNKQLRSLSEEIGKPISSSWLDTAFHRRDDEGLVRSKPIPGRREVIYFLTELGKKEAEKLIQKLESPTEKDPKGK